MVIIDKFGDIIIELLETLRHKELLAYRNSILEEQNKDPTNYKLKLIQTINKVIENNKSKPRIPFGSLVELGIIKPGTSLFDQKKKINAKIMADGSIKYKDTEGSIHKIAAKIMGAESYNGWTYWHYNLNGSTVLIDNLRQKFIAGKQI